MPQSISRRDTIKWISASAASCALGASANASAGGVLRFGGTGSASVMLQVLGNAFKRLNPGLDVTIAYGLGSTGGIQAVSDSALDIAVSARPLKPEEAGTLNALQFARSPYVIATSHPTPDPLASTDIARLIGDPQAKWSDGTPVRIILRPRNETDNALLGNLFPGAAPAIEVARKRSDVPIAVSDQDNATMAESIPGSLIGISLMQLLLEKRNLRPATIDGKTASLFNLESGAYHLARELHLVIAKSPSPQVAAFVAFLRSAEGADTLRSCSCQPLA